MTPASQPAKPPKKTSTVCQRCKKQHIRCDAGVRGSPCSNCHRAGVSVCEIIETKRARARTGRFIPNSPGSTVSEAPFRPPSSTPVSVQQSRSDRTTQLPAFSVDLASLCNSDNADANTPRALSGDRTHQQPEEERAQSHASPVWAESWYLSLVLQTTNNDDHRLYQPILDESGKQASITLDRNALPDTVSRSAIREKPRETDTGADFPSRELMQELLAEYFATFHQFCPIVDRRKALDSFNDGSISKVLLRCMLFVASIHCKLRIIYRLGYNSRIEAEDDLFNKARVAFDMDLETDRLTVLLSSYLLHYWSGSPNKTKDSLWWLAGSIRSAQAMGMHRSIEDSRAHPSIVRTWRRIWWLLYIRDRQISLSLGKPMQIHDLDCDIEMLEEDDLAEESPDIRTYVAAQAQLSITVSRLYQNYLAPASRSSGTAPVTESICSGFYEWRRRLPLEMQVERPSKTQQALLLSMTYRFYQILLHQRAQRRHAHLPRDALQSSNCTIMEAAEAITSLTEDAVTHLEARYFPMISLSAIFASMTAQYTQSRSTSLPAAQRQSLVQSVKYKLLALKEFEDCHVIAKWIRELFMDVFNKEKDGPTTGVESTNAAHARSEGIGEATAAAHPDPREVHVLSRDTSHATAQPTSSHAPSPWPNGNPGAFAWGEWTLPENMVYPELALMNNANFDAVGQLPFMWSDFSDHPPMP